MTWQGLRGQDEVVERFRRTLDRGRLASSYLFVGPPGVGKRTLALKLAQTLLCSRVDPIEMAPCGECPACQQVVALTHPDMEVIACPDDKTEFPVSLLIGDHDHRNKEGFCYNLSRKPMDGGRKIGIIGDADLLNKESGNCLLKILEEPPPRSLLILIGTHPQLQLPTIRSRCQTVHFRPLSTADLVDLVVAGGKIENRDRAAILAAQSAGGVHEALLWAEERLWPFRSELFDLLGQLPPDSERLGKLVQDFVNQESTSGERRKKLRLAVQLVEDFYRALLYKLLEIDELSPLGEPALRAAVEQAAKQAAEHTRSSGFEGSKIVVDSLDRCLVARKHIDQNANPAALIGCWVDDLVRCTSPANY